MDAPHAKPCPRRGRGLIAVAAVLAVLTAVGAWYALRPRPGPGPGPAPPTATITPAPVDLADPRLTADTPYRNVRPDVAYVGDEACRTCHQSESRAFHGHPMGRSVAPVAVGTGPERYGATAAFTAGEFRYTPVVRDGRVFHRESALDPQGRPAYTFEAEVLYVVGSGQRGRSYLLDRDGFVFMSPLTWYVQKGAWDLSPGYATTNPHFGRPVVADCLFCHANRVEPVAGTANGYRAPLFRGLAVGCERCHGPGEVHVRERRAGPAPAGVDNTIVNPAHLDPDHRDAVCMQCHLKGEARVLRRGRKPFDFRPGLTLDRFLSDFVKPPAAAGGGKFVGTFEQMVESKCYAGSKGPGRLGCTSCHDAHERPAPAERDTYYRGRCLECHADKGCSVPVAERRRTSPADSCIQCHMPTSPSDIPHTSVADHRVPRRPDAAPPPAAAADDAPLVYFHRDRVDANGADVRRDLGVALLDVADKQPPAAGLRLAGRALPLLRAALARDADDVAAREALGSAYWFLGQLPEALAAFDAGLEREPRRETLLYNATTLARRLGRPEAARRYLDRLLEVNPWRWQYHEADAVVRLEAGDAPGAAGAARKAVGLHPSGTGARSVLVAALLRQGDRAGAESELRTLLALTPPAQHDALRRRLGLAP